MATQKKSFWTTPNGLAALVFIGAVSYFLLIEHRQHLFEWLPFLIILLCPLMHIFMHGGHGHGGHVHEEHDHDHSEDKSDDEDAFRRGYEEGLKQNKQDRHD